MLLPHQSSQCFHADWYEAWELARFHATSVSITGVGRPCSDNCHRTRSRELVGASSLTSMGVAGTLVIAGSPGPAVEGEAKRAKREHVTREGVWLRAPGHEPG